jgi:tryptophan-rich sensory protein
MSVSESTQGKVWGWGTVLKIVTVLLVLIVGTLVNRGSLKSLWYKSLTLSRNQPPSYTFSIVWTLLYLGFTLVWIYVPVSDSKLWNILCVSNMFLNLLWSFTFFYFHEIFISKVVISALILLTLFQAFYVFREGSGSFSGVASFYFLIYASWLTVALSITPKL